jgi:Ras-related protein Rab-28
MHASRYDLLDAADMGHLRVVRPQQHKDLCEKEGMSSFFVSAKTGDQVAAMFFRIAADLCGVKISRPDLAIVSKVIPATIIDHAKDDPAVAAPPVGDRKAAGGKKRCEIQ